MNKTVKKRRLPGDPTQKEIIERIIRVNHAGEFGAQRIYQGQLAVLGRTPNAEHIRHMKAQEDRHLATFELLINERKVRPTIFFPLWNVAGFALGAGTALLGARAAMACTVAVEEVIDEHYSRQTRQLGDDETKLRTTIATFRKEELEHRDTAAKQAGQKTLGFSILHRAVQSATRSAIWLSERF